MKRQFIAPGLAVVFVFLFAHTAEARVLLSGYDVVDLQLFERVEFGELKQSFSKSPPYQRHFYGNTSNNAPHWMLRHSQSRIDYDVRYGYYFGEYSRDSMPMYTKNRSARIHERETVLLADESLRENPKIGEMVKFGETRFSLTRIRTEDNPHDTREGRHKECKQKCERALFVYLPRGEKQLVTDWQVETRLRRGITVHLTYPKNAVTKRNEAVSITSYSPGILLASPSKDLEDMSCRGTALITNNTARVYVDVINNKPTIAKFLVRSINVLTIGRDLERQEGLIAEVDVEIPFPIPDELRIALP